MRVRVKICGVTTGDTVKVAVEEGADALGFVFAESPRQISVEEALELAREVPAFITRVAVMRNPTKDQIVHVLSEFKPDMLQTELDMSVANTTRNIHGALLPVMHDDQSLSDQLATLDSSGVPFHTILLEGPGRGGRGVSPDWTRAASLAQQYRLVLAGGLRPENVATAIKQVRPYAVDVSSGVEETTGIKSSRLIAAFMAAVRQAEQQIEDVTSV